MESNALTQQTSLLEMVEGILNKKKSDKNTKRKGLYIHSHWALSMQT